MAQQSHIPLPSTVPANGGRDLRVVRETAAEVAELTQSYVDDEHRAGLAKAMAYIHAGQPGRAKYELVRSVERQARIAGIHTHISPSTPHPETS